GKKSSGDPEWLRILQGGIPMRNTFIFSVSALSAGLILIGSMTNAADVELGQSSPTPATNGSSLNAEPLGSVGPDVVVWDLQSYTNYSASGGYDAYSIGTVSCNVGDEPLLWISNNNQHPVIGQSMYRLAPGPTGHPRMEMIGQSWLKHGFCALSQSECGPCQATSCSTLGVNCSDPYTASRNGSQSTLGPKFEVNATTGVFPYPPASPVYSGSTARRLRVPQSMVTNVPSGSTFFVEGKYVCPDDNPTQGGNGDNNMSYRGVNLNNGGNIVGFTTETQLALPALSAWKAADPAVKYRRIGVPGMGQMIVASRSYDNGDGTWDYEYAVYNQNIDASIGRLIIPTNGDPLATAFGFACPEYHSGEPYEPTPWDNSTDANGIVFATESFAQNENANAIRWGTTYNFRFTSPYPPTNGQIELDFFKDTSEPNRFALVDVPDVPENCVADIDQSGSVDFDDLLTLLSAWDSNDPAADLDGSGMVEFNDLLTLLSAYGEC
ncbi:MAG: GC-type dockerin domain-anchored protein, partial [Planctomycetota bacterium]|nr:GC-type dockerin domain-anchored protein [Planctomycetota bacterium]